MDWFIKWTLDGIYNDFDKFNCCKDCSNELESIIGQLNNMLNWLLKNVDNVDNDSFKCNLNNNNIIIRIFIIWIFRLTIILYQK